MASQSEISSRALSRRTLLAGSVATLALAGCVSIPIPLGRSGSGSSPTSGGTGGTTKPATVPGRPLPANYFWRGNVANPVPPAGASAINGEQVRTPHADVYQAAAGSISFIDSHGAAMIGLEVPAEGVRPADGHDLLYVQLSAGVPPYTPKGSNPTFTLAAEGNERELELFGPYNDTVRTYEQPHETFLVSVPSGTAAVLEIADSKKTATIDLRTGRRGTDGSTKASELFLHRYTCTWSDKSMVWKGTVRTRPPAGYLAQSDYLQLTARVDNNDVSVTPWLPKYGWAPKGRMYLIVGAALNNKVHKGFLPQIKKLNLASTFWLTSGGKTYRPKKLVVDTDNLFFSLGSKDLVFVVPAKLRSATLHLKPKQTPVARYRNFPNISTYYTKNPKVSSKLRLKL